MLHCIVSECGTIKFLKVNGMLKLNYNNNDDFSKYMYMKKSIKNMLQTNITLYSCQFTIKKKKKTLIIPIK